MSFDLRRLAGCAIFLLIAAAPCEALADQAPPRTLTMSGQGIAKAAPDQAQFSTGVVTQERTAALALAANSRAMNAMFATLKRLGIPDKDIQTSNFSLSPQYQVCKPGAACPQRVVGYEVSNTVNVTVEDFGKTGAVLDALVSSGSNQIDNISFSIRDTSALLKEARAAAIKDAIQSHSDLCQGGGRDVGADSVDPGRRQRTTAADIQSHGHDGGSASAHRGRRAERFGECDDHLGDPVIQKKPDAGR